MSFPEYTEWLDLLKDRELDLFMSRNPERQKQWAEYLWNQYTNDRAIADEIENEVQNE